MIRVSVMYPTQEGSSFDLDYYVTTHADLVKIRMGSKLKGMTVDKGLGSGEPGSAAPYQVVGHLLFDSLEDFQAAFSAHAQELTADVPNYTNVQPTIQISEIALG